MNAILQFSLSASMVIFAGVFLARSADSIAKITGLGGLLVGSIFLAAATSLPELMVDISAVRQGSPNLAAGDLFGSCLFNLLILAICDLLHSSRGRMFSHSAFAHALSATQSTIMIALAGLGILLAPQLARFSVGSLDFGSIALMIAYLLGLRLVFLNQQFSHLQKSNPNQARSPKLRNALVKPILVYLSAAAIILISAPIVAESAAEIAEFSGLGNTFIGTTLLAFCTSLPELVSSYSAVRLGSYDLALGNIFGSNAFNMLLIVPLDFVSTGSFLAQISPTHLVTCVATIIITAVATMGQLFQVEKRRFLIEPDAFLVVTLVLGSLFSIYYLR